MKEQIFAVVQDIPYGRVRSYGQIAEICDVVYGIPTSWWMVGRMLSSMSSSQRKKSLLPRWRVVNKQGVISALKLGEKWIEQIRRLREEGVEIVDGVVGERFMMR